MSLMSTPLSSTLLDRLQLALEARKNLFEQKEFTAFRLFNGFYEGCPGLVVDLYAKTLLLYNYDKLNRFGVSLFDSIQSFLLEKLPWIECVIQKTRYTNELDLRRGRVTFGCTPDSSIKEYGVWYAIDLLMNQDASFYLDTRNLRRWLLENAQGWQVLNTFAYTGSLGVAALSAGSQRVIQVDHNRKFLQLARSSGILNNLDIGKMKLEGKDFYHYLAWLRREGLRFDCVIVDPPLFSQTKHGIVDLINESERLINKVRPVVEDGGYLIFVNNALFVSGEMYIRSLENLCKDGFLTIMELISIPADITGFQKTIVADPPSDPSPYNHPTKITVLRVKRK